jgi:hypothetical protein
MATQRHASTTSHRQSGDRLSSGGQEHAGALVQRRSGSQDIIYQQQLLSFDCGVSADPKSVAQVSHATATIEVRLSDRVASSLEGVTKLPPLISRQIARKNFGLIKFPLPSSQRMERHWHHRVKRFSNQAGIAQPLPKHLPKQSGEPCLAAILEAMNQLTHDPA